MTQAIKRVCVLGTHHAYQYKTVRRKYFESVGALETWGNLDGWPGLSVMRRVPRPRFLREGLGFGFYLVDQQIQGKQSFHAGNWGQTGSSPHSENFQSLSAKPVFSNHTRKRSACPRASEFPELLECDSHTQMHVTNTAANVYNPAHHAKSRNSVPRGRPGRDDYAESAG